MYTRTAMDCNLLFDDETVLDVSTDVVSAVGVANGQRLVWVEPYLISAAMKDRSGETLLELEG